MSIEMSQFYQVFFDEAEELLAEKEKLLLAIDVAAPDVEELNAIFRVAHSIKGGAATFGFSDMTEVTHMLESLLDRIRKGEMALTADHVDAFLAAKDVLKMQMDGHRHGEGTDRGAAEEVCQRLARLSHGAPAAPAAAPAPVAAAETAATAATAEAPAGAARFRIELPETPQRDVEALAAELGLMGELEQSRTADGHALFTLSTDVGEDAIVAVCAFVLDPDALKITRAEGGAVPAAPAAAPAPAAAAETPAGQVRFRIELPETPQRDVEALAAELGLMGELEQSRTADGHALFTLSTDVGEDAIVAVCAFVLDPDALKITRADVAEPPVPADEGASASEEPGYGIFEPPNFDPPARAAAAEQQSAAVPAEGESPSRRASDQVQGEAKNLGRRASDREAASQESSSIRVGIEKVDQLINLVGELVITQAMIEQRIGALDPLVHERLLNSAGQLARNTRDLQEAVMSIRMMPMEYVFSRFPRMVRDLAGKLGKKVEFVTRGAATELDKGLIERIVDPLTHLVRNSVDHGVEMPEVRRAAGKSETGRLILSAAHQGGNIVIEVSDDGGGLNRGKILAKALQNGLPVSDALSDAEVWQLIFAPGFSTAEVVTDVSGRGVGMDVVKRNITAMGGTVDIRSAPGYGTTITISLPLTLAILDGMSVRVGEETYILPLGYVIESLQPAPADVKEMAGQGRVVKVREEYLPLIPLHRIFAIEPRFTDPTQGIVVILEADGRKAALLVDALGGQQQVVVKNLESNFRKVAGISGATILGDGGVSLILDVSALLRSSRQLDIESVFS